MYATLLSLLFVLFCGSDGAQGTFAEISSGACVVESVERIEATDRVDDAVSIDAKNSPAACSMECGCSLRLPVPVRSVSRLSESGPGASTARSIRCAARMTLCDAAAGYVAGRVTRLFDFNLYRASLRRDFFLHALCRLRI